MAINIIMAKVGLVKAEKRLIEGLPKVVITPANIVTYKPIEELTVSDLDQLQLHACNMARVLKYGKSDAVIERFPEIRKELHAVVQYLYQFNINLTNLLQ